MTAPDVNPPNPSPTRGAPWAWTLVVLTGVVFWPVTRWIVAESAARQQIRQGGVLLLAAIGLVAWQHRRELHVAGDLSNRTLALLGASFALVGAAGITHLGALLLPAFTLALAGCLHALFGAQSYRFFKPLVTGVGALLVIIVAFPVLDWPLRQLAGVQAAALLEAMHLAPGLTLTGTAANPQLILTVGGRAFLVATECNGFGLITSGALLAILAGGIAGRRGRVIAALVPLAMATGFAVNVLRILTISLGAPLFPDHYDVLHEVVGTLCLWLGLGLVGWMAWRPVETGRHVAA
ncbi:MAG: archaeosortase/exosortase family protein [Verrucomicrobia bacterium]|nr:archaeosortase/exosortase family protein [Verrucomicrobiota bacterium]